MGYLFKQLAYLKAYKRQVLLSLFLLSISVTFTMIQPKLIEWAIDKGIGAQIIQNIIMGAVGILILGIIGNIAHLFSGFLLIKSAQGLSHDVRSDLFKKVVSLSFSNFDKWRTGELMVRLNSDVNTIRMFVRMGLFMVFQSLVTIIGSIVFMFLTDVRLATIVSIIMAAGLILSVTFVTFMRPLFIKMREKLDELNNTLQENLTGAKVVRAFNRQDHERDKFNEKNRDLYEYSLKVGYRFGTFMPLLMFIGNLSITLILWLGGVEIIRNVEAGISGFTLGQLIAFNNYAMTAIFPLFMLGMVLNFVAMASASAERLDKLMVEKSGIQPPESPLSLDQIQGKIEIQNVCFGYGEGENAVCDANLTIQAGEKIGIIGGTGSGKTSLVSLIPRLYDPKEGKILVDGRDIREYDPIQLRQRISMVLQDPILFSGSIEYNVMYGNPEGSIADGEWAAGIAQALPFIEEKGWDGNVGERGTGLSGGQRQRVAIARAVAAKPSIIILDDVTSSLDLETEKNVTKGIYDELKDVTTLIISQKIQTVKESDRIIVMDKGQITGVGTHEELLASNDIYRQIAETQNEYIQ